MKRGLAAVSVLGVIGAWLAFGSVTAHAEIASDNAFEGAVWEKIIEQDLEAGVLQSMCATEDYIICMENYAEDAQTPDVIKAFYRNDRDADGNPVEKYSLAKRVADISYEHSNGMAYNPNTKEIAVALYTHYNPENRGCIFLLDSETLSFKEKIKIADDYNILGIDYDEEKDRYVIQTNSEGGYSFKILDNQFQVTEDLGQYAGTAKGDNFQDLCVSGDYIINFPLTLNMGIGDYVNMYSISRRELVSEAQLDFRFENVAVDEPEGICELEPGVFAAVVNEDRTDGSRKYCVYKTMVPYNFSAEELKTAGDKESVKDGASAENGTEQSVGNERGAEPGTEQSVGKEQAAESGTEKTSRKHSAGKAFLKTMLVLTVMLAGALAFYARLVAVKRERRRKMERARRERRRIQAMYAEES